MFNSRDSILDIMIIEVSFITGFGVILIAICIMYKLKKRKSFEISTSLSDFQDKSNIIVKEKANRSNLSQINMNDLKEIAVKRKAPSRTSLPFPDALRTSNFSAKMNRTMNTSTELYKNTFKNNSSHENYEIVKKFQKERDDILRKYFKNNIHKFKSTLS